MRQIHAFHKVSSRIPTYCDNFLAGLAPFKCERFDALPGLGQQNKPIVERNFVLVIFALRSFSPPASGFVTEKIINSESKAMRVRWSLRRAPLFPARYYNVFRTMKTPTLNRQRKVSTSVPPAGAAAMLSPLSVGIVYCRCCLQPHIEFPIYSRRSPLRWRSSGPVTRPCVGILHHLRMGTVRRRPLEFLPASVRVVDEVEFHPERPVCLGMAPA
jgi:hypothetical protein